MTPFRFVWTLAAATLFAAVSDVRAGVPEWLPRYEVQFELDVAKREVVGAMQATWTNRSKQPVGELVLNAHSRYVVPDSEIGFDAKMLEILRMTPSEVLGVDTPCLDIQKITLAGKDSLDLPFRYEGDTKTALVVPLPAPLKPGESVTIDLRFTFHIPKKQGRWGCWQGITTLANWLPVFAVFDDTQIESDPVVARSPDRATRPTEGLKKPVETVGQVQWHGQETMPQRGETVPQRAPYSKCWQPTPFVPWHQPFFNDAGIYRVRAVLPCEQKVACTGTVVACKDVGNGRQQVDIDAIGVRDFAFLCSERYCVHEGVVAEQLGVPKPIRIRVLAFPEHAHYAKEFVRIAAESLMAYSRWFGPYPYEDFTIAESFFGWNGNECATLVMIDERVFAMPRLAKGFADSLLSHEICHQWWYNLIGANGYSETWMDEALATHFSHRMQNEKYGRNNELMSYPRGLEWAPNIRREDYRSYSLLGTVGRGENGPVVQDMPKFGHLVNLFSMCYDKGSRIVGMIESRLGETAFHDFMRLIYKKYQYRILRVADFQRELEEYTGESWDKFFKDWLYGVGLGDWAVEKVVLHDRLCATCPGWLPRRRCKSFTRKCNDPAFPVRVTVHLKQRGEVAEQTVLGFNMPGCEGYSIRVPIVPQAGAYRLESPPTEVTPTGKNEVRVEIQLPAEPEQIAVDPDQVLIDTNPANNFWKPAVRWRLTPVYTFLEETDMTNAYDRWNVIAGPWLYGTAYDDAWYTRAAMFGVRAGLYRTQQFYGGAYSAYRTNFRDFVAGADGMWDHWPSNRMQLGFNIEKRLAASQNAENQAVRAAGFARYVLQAGDSLYLPPMEYVETFTAYQDNFLPYAKWTTPQGERFTQATTAGIHYHIDYRTPYWDPEGGYLFDIMYEGGVAELERQHGLHKLAGQLSYVQSLPDLTEYGGDTLRPALQWLADTRVAVRAYGATGLPTRGLFFTLGGSELFRGFDMAERQGSTVWVGSVEWRVALARGLNYDCFDHIIGLRNVYGALFYDVGDAYTSSRSVGPVAHAVGAGLRLDVAWFSFVERTTLRFDLAKTVNAESAMQFWLSVGHPF